MPVFAALYHVVQQQHFALRKALIDRQGSSYLGAPARVAPFLGFSGDLVWQAEATLCSVIVGRGPTRSKICAGVRTGLRPSCSRMILKALSKKRPSVLPSSCNHEKDLIPAAHGRNRDWSFQSATDRRFRALHTLYPASTSSLVKSLLYWVST